MNYTNDNIKKICNFYMSDWHFTVMLLPYINKEINRNTKIITVLEKDMTDKVEALVEKLNLKNKDEILNINWKNTDMDGFFYKLRDELEYSAENLLIVNGTNYYIKEINNKIRQELNKEKYANKNIKIIDCYDFDSNKENMSNILKGYNGMLNTSGEIKIEEVL